MFRFVTNWNVLVPFGSGDLTVDCERGEVCYLLSYRQLVISSAPMFAAGLIALVLIGLPLSSWLFPASPFIYLFGVASSVGVGVLRFRHFLRRAIATAPEAAG
ncbi:MAG TPA: hypothetical protein VF753_06600 [Terriglobales bacterium]